MDILDPIRLKARAVMRQVAKGIHAVSKGHISPNMVTTVGVGMHIPIAVLIAQDKLILAGLLHIVFALFDTIDGELARLTKKASPFGMMYDASTDRLKIGFLFAGITQYLVNTGQGKWAFIPLLAFAVATVVSYVKAKGEVGLVLKHPKMSHHEINRFFKEGLIPYDVLNIMITLGLLLQKPLEASWVILVLGSLTLVWLIKRVSQEV